MTDNTGDIPLDQVDTSGMTKGQLKKHKDKLKAWKAAQAGPADAGAPAKEEAPKKGGKKLTGAAAAALKKREEAAAAQAEMDAENAKLDAEFQAKLKAEDAVNAAA